MKKINFIIIVVILFVSSCSNKNEEGTFTDSRDGKVYKIIKIGEQIWMAENLNYTKGIPNIINDTEWGLLKNNNVDIAWCYYDNKQENGDIYGALYTYGAAIKVCPNDWHLPTDYEWLKLTNYLGGEEIAGKKLKNLTGWLGNGNGTNKFGFSALPGGSRRNDGIFVNVGGNGLWWSATHSNSSDAWVRFLIYDDTEAIHHDAYKSSGYSVRCVKNDIIF